MPIVLQLKGQVNSSILKKAFGIIMNRHEVLRTVYKEVNGQVSQEIRTSDGWELKTEIVKLEEGNTIASLVEKAMIQPFDLSADYMLRAKLLELTPTNKVLAIIVHHIAADGWSIAIMIKELVTLYQSLLDNKIQVLTKLPIQYVDYAVWQRNHLDKTAIANQLKFWEKQLKGVAPLNLPTDYLRPAVQSTRGKSFAFKVDEKLSKQLLDLSKTAEATLFMTLLTVFKILLFRYSGQSDICVGSPIANRSQQVMEPLIGFFVNTVALRNELVADNSFIELLTTIKTTTLEAYNHQGIPFEQIVERIVQVRDRSRTPLFQVMFSLQNKLEAIEIELPEVRISNFAFEHKTSKFDLSFAVNETKEGLAIEIEYCSDLFDQARIERMSQHYRQLLESVVQNPHEKIGILPMVLPEENNQLLNNFNSTVVDYPKDKTILDLLEEQQVKTPNKIAIVFGEQTLTYQELANKSNQLGAYLKGKKVQKGDLVAICMAHSIEVIIGILGILRIGAVYVPIEPTNPNKRINFILKDIGAKYLLCKKETEEKLQLDQTIETILLDEHWPIIAKIKPLILNRPTLPKDLVYVLYTSGSTGKPKGVKVSHQNLVNYFHFAINNYAKGFTAFHCPLFTSLAFDLTQTSIFLPLLTGGQLHIYAIELLDETLAEICGNTQLNTLKLTPAHVPLLENIDTLIANRVIIGGEKLERFQVQKLFSLNPQLTLFNEYGPTETTIGVTVLKLTDPAQAINIGKPIANTQIYILDQQQQVVPIGVIGEIYIGGAGVTQGYLNRANLTKAKFVDNPFEQIRQTTLYKSGDMGYWLPDGNISYVGRTDDQVKIRGHRIELGAIDTVLQKCPLVKQGVVLARKDKAGDAFLAAYIVPHDTFKQAKIQAFLREQLPAFMLPSLMVQLEIMPLNANGKVDKKALANKQLIKRKGEGGVPPNKLEVQLLQIWQDLLGLEKIGRTDNFFELGGHSLMATRLIAAIRSTLAIELGVKALFNQPTIATLAKFIREEGQVTRMAAITTGQRPDKIPLSFSQERLWFIDRFQGSQNYHMPIVLRLSGEVEFDLLELVFQKIINRHEILRTVYKEEGGQAYQKILAKDKWKLNVRKEIFTDEKQLKKGISDYISKVFDLSEDHLLRAR